MGEENFNGQEGLKRIKDALVKKALGYDATETVEEYSEEDGEIRLVKKRVTVKNVPPDVSALKMLMEETQRDFSELSDQQLIEEKARLLKELLKEEKNKKEKKNCNLKDKAKKD